MNNLYTTGFRGKRVLSKQGIAFKSALTAAVAEECMRRRWKLAVDEIYARSGHVEVHISVHKKIFNESWKPKGKTKKGARQSPYKKLDATSYIKAIELAVVDGTGIDDSAHLMFVTHKGRSDREFSRLLRLYEGEEYHMADLNRRADQGDAALR